MKVISEAEPKPSWWILWTVNLRIVGGWLSLASALAILFGLAQAILLWQTQDMPLETARVVETIVPLLFGIQAALLFSPDSEPALEVLLAAPRSLPRILSDRLVVLIMLQGGIAVLGSSIGVALQAPEPWLLALARWIAPCVAIGGAALFTAQVTRQGIFGALLATLLWIGMLLGGDALLSRFPFLWPAHLYLQPEAVPLATYALNRLILILAGSVLAVLGIFLSRDEERVLGTR